jgi:hypothetical protein
MKSLSNKQLLLFTATILVVVKVNGQTAMPEELTKNSITDQLTYLEEHTRIYENYRAIREDMFQKMKSNFIDTLASDKNVIDGLENLTSNLKSTTDSLNIILSTTRNNLEEITATKNSISVLGIEINKVAYNTIMWTIIAIMAVALVIGFLFFKRNLFTTIRTGKELKELKDEFEEYRQSSRIAREKMSMDHFNEIQRLKGKS